jgi:hypothetical protein
MNLVRLDFVGVVMMVGGAALGLASCGSATLHSSDGAAENGGSGGTGGSKGTDGVAGIAGSATAGTNGRGGVGGVAGGLGGGGAGGVAGSGTAGAGAGGTGGGTPAAGSIGGVAGGTGGRAGVGGAAGGGMGGTSSGGAAGKGMGGTSGCASVCGGTQTCVGSTCLLNDGQQCALVAQCASGACTPFYQDVDGDGYGSGAATGFCGTTTPIGYAAQTGDCCDNASNLALAKLIHPNAGFQTTSAGGVCGVTWDYDCDGTIETSLSNGECGSASVYPSCTRQFMNYPEADCGMMNITDYTCVPETVPSSTGSGTMNICAGGDVGGPQTLGCR